MFKKLHIKIPFADGLEHMPNYVRFLKEMMSKKHKAEEFKTISLIEEFSDIVQRKLPKKDNDPGALPFLARSATPHLPIYCVIWAQASI